MKQVVPKLSSNMDVDVHGCQFSSTSVACAYFSDVFDRIERVHGLVLYRTAVSSRAMRSLFASIERRQTLAMLDIYFWSAYHLNGTRRVLNSELRVVADCLPRCPCIKVLAVGAIQDVDAEVLCRLAAALQLSGVTEFALTDTWDQTGGASLAAARATGLVMLRLNRVGMRQETFDELCGILCDNGVLQTLELAENRFTNLSCMIPLLKRSKTLRRLKLDFNRLNLTERFADALTDSYSIQTLDIFEVRTVHDAWAAYLLRTTLRSHATLRAVNIINTRVRRDLRIAINDRLTTLGGPEVSVMVALASSKAPRLRAGSAIGQLLPAELLRLLGAFLFSAYSKNE